MGSFIIPVISGIIIGSLSGLVGIGGGVLLVPLLLYVFHLNMHSAAGTSLSIVLPMSLVGALSHFQRGNVDWRLTLLIGAGSVIGSMLGAWGGSLLPGETLKKIFAFLLLIISLKVLADAYGISLPGFRAETVAPVAPAKVAEPAAGASRGPLPPSGTPSPGQGGATGPAGATAAGDPPGGDSHGAGSSHGLERR